MKFVIVVLAFAGLAFAAEKDGEATIVDGSEKVAEYFTNTGYDYKFKTSNTIVKEEIADLAKNIVTGAYEYVDPDGRTVKVTYTAGAGIGFNPKSTPDVIAPQIVESIELNLKNPPEDTKK